MKSLYNSNLGFTLVEMVVTMALLAILATLAVPSLVTFRRNAEMTSIVNSFVASLNAARSESMKRNLNAMVVSKDSADWTKGWNVFVDKDSNGSFDASKDIVIMEQPALPAYVSVRGNQTFAGNPNYFMFDSSGFPRTKLSGFPANATLQVNRNDASSTDFNQMRLVVISVAGRVSVCTPKSNSDPECTLLN